MAVTCSGCGLRIVDRYLLRVHDQLWHERCLRCSHCQTSLDSTCFARQGQVYCRNDFYRLFGPKCSGCHGSLLPADLVRRVGSSSFHVNCCACVDCGRLLSTGEQLRWTDRGHLLCSSHWTSQGVRIDTPAAVPTTPDVYYPSPLGGGLSVTDSSALLMPSLSPPQQLATSRTDSRLLEGSGVPPAHTQTLFHHYHELGQATALRASPSATQAWPSATQESTLFGVETEREQHGVHTSDEGHSPDDSDHEEEEGEEEGVGPAVSSATGDPDTNWQQAKQGGKRPKSQRERKEPKLRGPRTTIIPKQLEVLKNTFANTPKPSRSVREQLSRETGLSIRVIQVWFQNRRSKERRVRVMAAERASAIPPPGQPVESAARSCSPRTTSLLLQDAVASADGLRSHAARADPAEIGDSTIAQPHQSATELQPTGLQPSGQEVHDISESKSPPLWEKQPPDYSWTT